MSCFNGKKHMTEEEKAQAKNNSKINKNLKEAAPRHKLLLLGTGDAGKSTFCKQMQLLHSGGFRKEEIERFSEILKDNCLVSMQTILLAAKEWEFTFPDEVKENVDNILNAQTDLTAALAEDIAKLNKTKPIEETMLRANELQIPGGASGAQYFFENCERFAAPGFEPTPEDMMRAKMRTTGISEVTFTINGEDFTMVDVGGQRSERRKWLHCFGDVSAVIFLVAMNEYDMALEEDNRTNRMEESIKLFQKLSGSQWFDQISFILFLNKADLFQKKIEEFPLSDAFEDYDDFVKSLPGAKNMENSEKGFEYIKKQYKKNFDGKNLYCYKTCAIDKGNCGKVFKAVQDTVLKGSLEATGLIK